jgi:hypothetical protein
VLVNVLPEDSTWLVMTNLEGEIPKEVGNLYGLRTWIEYGFKQIKNELGWADFRLTRYGETERWWKKHRAKGALIGRVSQPVVQTVRAHRSRANWVGTRRAISSLAIHEMRLPSTYH